MAKTGTKRNKLEITTIYDLEHYASEAIFYVIMGLPDELRERAFGLAIKRVTSRFQWERKYGSKV